MNRHFLIFAFLLLAAVSVSAQLWGLCTLYATDIGTAAYLIDKNSTFYNSWTFSSLAKPAYSTYMTSDKAMVGTYASAGNPWSGSGFTGGEQKADWSGNVICCFQYYASNDCSGSASVTVLIYSVPPAPVICQIGNDLTPTAAGTFQWNVDGVAVSGVISQTITATESGACTVVVSNAAGGLSESGPYLSELSGIYKMNSETVVFIPNPRTGIVKFTGNMIENGTFAVGVSDITARSLMRFEKLKTADLSGISDGVYSTSVRNTPTTVFLQKTQFELITDI